MNKPMNRGIDIILSVDNNKLGGQLDATLNRSMTPINITNKINGEWETSLSGTKTWNIYCEGLVVKNEQAFKELENSFNAGTAVDVELTDGNVSYSGRALITDFPVSAPYNTNFSYTITLLGISELE